MSLVNIGNSDDPAYRYKMPKLISKTEGRGNGIKTILVNATEVASALHRPTSYLPKYFGYELGAQSKYDQKEEKASVNGDHQNADLTKILSKFIEEYVLCPNCKLPETMLVLKHKKDIIHRCAACGAETLIAADNKMNTFIMNEITKMKDTKEKKEKKSKKGEESPKAEEEKKEKKNKKDKNEGEDDKKEKKHKHGKDKKEKSSTSMFIDCSSRLSAMITDDITAEAFVDAVKEIQNASALLMSDRAAIAVYAICLQLKSYDELPALLERFGEAVRGFIIKTSVEERVIVAMELYLFKTPALRAYIAALLKFLYDVDVLSEDVILKWSEEPLKHRFSCLTEKYVKELIEVADPLVQWLMNATGSEEEEGEIDMMNMEEEVKEGDEIEEKEGYIENEGEEDEGEEDEDYDEEED